MGFASVADDIIPIAQVKAHASEWFKKLNTGKDAVIITNNGRAAGVLVSPSEYDRLVDQRRFFEAIHEGLSDVSAGNVFSTADVRKKLGL